MTAWDVVVLVLSAIGFLSVLTLAGVLAAITAAEALAALRDRQRIPGAPADVLPLTKKTPAPTCTRPGVMAHRDGGPR